MSNLLKVISLLKTGLETDEVYSGQIPESLTEPAVLVQELANGYTRTTEGVKINKSNSWRITVVAKYQSDVELLLEKLEDLDNTANVDFQRVFTNLVLTEPGLNEQPFRRAFYDLTVYIR